MMSNAQEFNEKYQTELKERIKAAERKDQDASANDFKNALSKLHDSTMSRRGRRNDDSPDGKS